MCCDFCAESSIAKQLSLKYSAEIAPVEDKYLLSIL